MADHHSGPAVLIVGASSGIGRATAHHLARRHARLALVGRSTARLSDVGLECRELGAGQVVLLPMDVTDSAATDRTVNDAAAAFGRLDAIVHCAAVLAYGRFEDIPAEVFDQVIRTNLCGTANVARAALRQWGVQGGGRLVIVSSLLGKVAIPYSSPYVTSKWAVHGLARVLQLEARRTPGVEVIVVSPGSVDTPIYARAGNYFGRPGRPIPPIDRPERVAAAIVRTIDRPRRERSVGRANHIEVIAFRLLTGVFDRLVGPVTRLFGFRRKQLSEPHPGNIFEPGSGADQQRSSP
jgi:NAD(P)-dependent dehydrogenase (short-subunit alcohol dehydrogenase family)